MDTKLISANGNTEMIVFADGTASYRQRTVYGAWGFWMAIVNAPMSRREDYIASRIKDGFNVVSI